MYRKGASGFNRIITRFKNARILVIGDIMLDRFIWGTVSRISPEAPVPVVRARSESFMPGGASNVSNNIAALGAEVYMCGVIGDDDAGRRIVSELLKNGINSDGIVIDGGRPTTSKTRIIAHHQQVVRIDRESDSVLNSRITAQALSYIKNKLPDVDAVIIEDYGKGLILPHLIKEVKSSSLAHRKIIMVDPKQDHLKLYKGVTAITPNRREAESASGVKIDSEESLKEAGARLLNILSSEAILITLGEDGMALFQKKGRYLHIPTVAQEVYDVSGAGDTVIGVFALAKTAGAGMVEAAHIANLAAGAVVGKLGISACTVQDLKSHINHVKRYGLTAKEDSYPSESIFYKTGKANLPRGRQGLT